MTNIDIDDEVYKRWGKLYEKQDPLIYPSLKNFTTRKLLEIIEQSNGHKKEKNGG